VSGNVTKYVYHRDYDMGTAYPKAIEYTYHGGTPVGELRSVEFFLETRDDWIYGFPGGVETRVTQRVREIRSMEGAQVYRRLILDYTSPQTATTERTRLTSAQLFGTDCDPETAPDVCVGLPAQTFTYNDVRRPRFSWTQISYEYDVQGGRDEREEECKQEGYAGAYAGSPEGDRRKRRRRLVAGAALERRT
jgi:hypothetical protein